MSGAAAASADEAREPVLRAAGVVRRLGATLALDDLSLEVRPGELYGLVGPDGAGKSTAMRIFAGMIGVQGGEVRVFGASPMSGAAEVRNAIGYMPQQYSLYGDLSIDENLRFFARMFCLPRAVYAERRERLLGITRLARFTDRRADALSGGMYKKLALACALLPRPRLLLLDEPTNGVDPISRRELWALLFELAAEGMAIVVSTAYMDEAARCHRVGLLHGGALLVEGTPAELLAGFEHLALDLRGEDLFAIEQLLSAHGAVLATSVVGDRVHVVAREEAEEELGEALARAGAAVERVRPDFEDLFLAETAAATARAQEGEG